MEEYEGDKVFSLCCTQLDCKPSEQSKIAAAWCELFSSQQLPIEKLWVVSRISQKILNAICCQKNLNSLWIKWGVYNDISKLANLENLEYLHLGGGASLDNVDVLARLAKLKSLEADCLFAIHDYSHLVGLKNLTDLAVYGDGLASNKRVKLNSLGFLVEMPQLERLDLCMVKVEDGSYLPITKLPNLKFLGLPRDKNLGKDRVEIDAFIKRLGI
ncbi:hypothetical protein AGMMS50225_04670 [Betaproteobacteria bacterium]|nr:hypothetical protein AGMMS50225_04670 [Betaproteobacteria bacterium]